MSELIIKSPVFLLGSHKSGTSLLRSLLDNHPELFVVPIEMHFFKYVGYWVDYTMQRSWPQKLTMQEKCQILIKNLDCRNQNDNPYSDSVIPDVFDIEAFTTCLKQQNPQTDIELFCTYIRALYYSLQGDDLPASIRPVEKSVENAEYAILLKQLFPNCKLIHIVRNPYSTLVSIRKSKTLAGFPYLGSIIQSLQNSYYHLYKNQMIIDDYFVIQYEDLLISTHDSMQSVANFLNIAFDEGLLQPTLLGRDWRGNSTSNQSFNQVSLAPLQKWKADITPLEVHLVNHFFVPILSQFSYDRLPNVGNYWSPVMTERPVSYLKNRSLIKMLGR